jgi:phenylpropionate dioxygenase-like ring-hydroxylating dioxygenase large terminal subunit
MGENVLREYWLPAALSDEVTPDGAPLRVKLPGEHLIAFRDTSSRVSLLVDHTSRYLRRRWRSTARRARVPCTGR